MVDQADMDKMIIDMKSKNKQKKCKCQQALIVDDNAFNLYVLGTLLSNNGVTY